MPGVAVSRNVLSIYIATPSSGAILLPNIGGLRAQFRLIGEFSVQFRRDGLDVGAFPIAHFAIPVESVAFVFQTNQRS